jgi:signal transduction histidine kinase
MNYHHVAEAAGIVSLGIVVFSYLVRWFEGGSPARRRWRGPVNGAVFGALAVVLMVSRIDIGGDHFVDARAIPIALAMLVEGFEAGSIAAAFAVAYRIWMGGSGAPAGVLGIVAVAAVAGLVRAWARRDGGVGVRHGLVLVLAVWAITAASFLVLGARGAAMFEPVWLPVLTMIAIGLGAGVRLFGDVVAGQAAEAARRDAAELRAVASLARMAAHEINNPLTAVLGGLTLATRNMGPESNEAKWLNTARLGAEEIRDIVKRMNRITSLEETPSAGPLPPMLDIRKSSGPS